MTEGAPDKVISPPTRSFSQIFRSGGQRAATINMDLEANEIAADDIQKEQPWRTRGAGNPSKGRFSISHAPIEKGYPVPPPGPPPIPDDHETKWDDPSNRLWKYYAEKAEIHDKILTESWKVDTDGTLIFSGLFSSVVTAFLLTSLQALQPSSDDSSAILLQISAQLAVGGNTLPPATPPDSMSPSLTMIWVNSLWIVSLILALASALLSTLIQQWSRDYFHAVTRDPVPRNRSRIRSFLFEGVEKFGMQAVVALVPLILQLAVFLFFVGLVVYIQPMDSQVFTVTLGIVLAVSCAYCTLSILPALYSHCPFKTPISRITSSALYALCILIGSPAIAFRRYRDRPFRLVLFKLAHDIAHLLQYLLSIPGKIKLTTPHLPFLHSAVHAENVAGEVLSVTAARDRDALEWLVGNTSEDAELTDIVKVIPEYLSRNNRFSADVIADLLGSESGDRLATLVLSGRPERLDACLNLFWEMIMDFRLSREHGIKLIEGRFMSACAVTMTQHLRSTWSVECVAVCTSVRIACIAVACPDSVRRRGLLMILEIPGASGGFGPFSLQMDRSRTYLLLSTGLLHAVFTPTKRHGQYHEHLKLTENALLSAFSGFVLSCKDETISRSRLLFLITSPILHGCEISLDLLKVIYGAYRGAISQFMTQADLARNRAFDSDESLDTDPGLGAGLDQRTAGAIVLYAAKQLHSYIATNPKNIATCQQLVALLLTTNAEDSNASSNMEMPFFSLRSSDLPRLRTQDSHFVASGYRVMNSNTNADTPQNLASHAHQFVVRFGSESTIQDTSKKDLSTSMVQTSKRDDRVNAVSSRGTLDLDRGVGVLDGRTLIGGRNSEDESGWNSLKMPKSDSPVAEIGVGFASNSK